MLSSQVHGSFSHDLNPPTSSECEKRHQPSLVADVIALVIPAAEIAARASAEAPLCACRARSTPSIPPWHEVWSRSPGGSTGMTLVGLKSYNQTVTDNIIADSSHDGTFACATILAYEVGPNESLALPALQL